MTFEPGFVEIIRSKGLPQFYTLLSLLTSSTSLAVYALLLILAYHVSNFLDYPVLFPPEYIWNCLVYIVPSRLIFALDVWLQNSGGREGQGEEHKPGARGHAAKSQVMRRMLGLDGAGVLTTLQRARGLSGLSSSIKAQSADSLPGLGNWDNSCYQNSILQGLASLPSLSNFLNQSGHRAGAHSTKDALLELMEKLNDPSNMGHRIWTPPALKNMSSWQQQDAQEYYSKVLDEVERDVAQAAKVRPGNIGLKVMASLILDGSKDQAECKVDDVKKVKSTNSEKPSSFDKIPDELLSFIARNPLEGLQAQRVGCLQCGYVEGLSLIPFNCLTVPLGKEWMYDIRACLDDFTALEPINGVECAKCTILRNRQQLERLLAQPPSQILGENVKGPPGLTEALRISFEERLEIVNQALANKDFSDSTLSKKCQIPTKGRVSTTKSRQAVIARPPKALVVHVNRSVFDELSGMQSKNYASVRFPKILDLTPWCLGAHPKETGKELDEETWVVDPAVSMLPDNITEDLATYGDCLYQLQAVITHYGRHENGHYICYRKSPHSSKRKDDPASEDGETWWRLSDDEVARTSEEDVLGQGGVFMLFYERLEQQAAPPQELGNAASKIKQPAVLEVELDREPTEADTALKLVTLDGLDPEESIIIPMTQAMDLAPESPASITSPSISSSPPSQSITNTADSTSNATNLSMNLTKPSTSSPITFDPIPVLPPTTTLSPPPSSTSPSPPSNQHPSPEPQSDISRTPSPIILKENTNTTPPMRTAPPRSGRGSVSRANKKMGMGASMVQAN